MPTGNWLELPTFPGCIRIKSNANRLYKSNKNQYFQVYVYEIFMVHILNQNQNIDMQLNNLEAFVMFMIFVFVAVLQVAINEFKLHASLLDHFRTGSLQHQVE